MRSQSVPLTCLCDAVRGKTANIKIPNTICVLSCDIHSVTPSVERGDGYSSTSTD
jgi:hypothetical protein